MTVSTCSSHLIFNLLWSGRSMEGINCAQGVLDACISSARG